MHPKQRPTDPASKQAPEAPATRRRFRIDKLEERIAPKKGGKGTHNCGGGDSSTTDTSFTCSGSVY